MKTEHMAIISGFILFILTLSMVDNIAYAHYTVLAFLLAIIFTGAIELEGENNEN